MKEEIEKQDIEEGNKQEAPRASAFVHPSSFLLPPSPVPLAIVGIGCLFPGAGSFAAYWASIKNRVDAIREVPPSHWRPEDYHDPDPKASDRIYTVRGGFLEPVLFNPADYGIAPTNLEAIDTAQLLGLVVARQAFEDAGYDVMSAERGARSAFREAVRSLPRERTSVILGVTGTLELVIPLGARLGHPAWRRALQEAGVEAAVAEDVVRRIGDSYVGWQENSFPGLLGNVVAGRIANRFDLGGTNCVVDAACASSLSALHLAALELETGRADVVLTGGVDTFNDVFMFTCFSKTPALSPTGDARPFDREGDGTILGEGLGMVVLKRLVDAERDGDRIYAVVRGLGTSSDGRGNAVYAPKKEGQIEALRRAYREAGVTPDTVELVEAHGTGTRVGDATEVEALGEVFGATGRSGTWCALGSVKSQIGHTKAAAGAAGLIKVAAALYYKVMPPTLKVRRPLDALQGGRSPFYVNAEPRPWLPSPQPRRAGVSAFGFGGSNYHCVLEEHRLNKQEIDWDGDVQIVPFTADHPAEIERQLADWPENPGWEELRDRAGQARSAFQAEAPCRLVLVFQRGKTDLARLRAEAHKVLLSSKEKTQSLPEGVYFGTGSPPGKLAFLFPGQGAQQVGMLRDLACLFPEMQETLAEANRTFGDVSGRRLSDFLYPPSAFTPEERAANEAALRETAIAQPALGAVSLGAARVLERFAIRPEATAGHSFGELTALCVAGRLRASDFLTLARLRGRLMTERGSPTGSMLAVQAGAEIVARVLQEQQLDLVLANKNAPAQTVLSGLVESIEKAVDVFSRRQIPVQRLAVAGAFHSPLVATAAEPFRAALETVPLEAGTIPVFANSTGSAYPAEAAQARDLLASQLAQPVEFVQEIESLFQWGVRTFLEVGPGARLSGLVRAILKGRPFQALAVDGSPGGPSGTLGLAHALAELAALGHAVRLTAWDPWTPPSRPASGNNKPTVTVELCGANYRKPRPRPTETRHPAVPPAPSPQRAIEPNEVLPVPQGSNPASLNGTTASISTPPPDSSGGLAQALQITRESLAALQRVQEQTAHLHRQFLEGQEAAQRTIHLLVEQQQRFLQASLSMPLSTLPSTAPSVPPPAWPEPVLPSLAPPVAAPSQRPPAAEPNHQPATPVSVSASLATPPVPAQPTADVERVLREVVAEKTGYPVEVLEPDMALDADLGIDSIKRVEILSALQERLPEAPIARPEHLASLQTLRQVADFLKGSPTNGTAAAKSANLSEIREVPASAQQEERRPSNLADVSCGKEVEAIERSVLRIVPLGDRVERQGVSLAPGSEIWLTAEDFPLAQTLVRQLSERGFRPRLFPCAALKDLPRPDQLGGLIVIAPAAGTTDSFLKDALLGTSRVAHALRRTGAAGGAIFVTVSRLDGAFGLKGLDPAREPVDGGLAGLAKTAAHEWPEVSCKALDLANDWSSAEEMGTALVEEALWSGPVEVGLSSQGRCTLERVPRARPANSDPAPLNEGEVVVLTGGGRGVTAEVAVALARAYRPTLVLLGRSPAPQPEPEWLTPLTTETEIKRELGIRANGNASPRLIGEQYTRISSNREIGQTLARIEAAGARAVYVSGDVRDAEAVAEVLAKVRREFGPVRGLVHGAGVLADARLGDKTAEQFERVYGTKVGGLRSLLAALAPDELRWLVLFSSSTARFGRTGQADYAMANEVLNKVARQQAQLRPGCRVVSLNWGPWDGGMVTPALKQLFQREGIGVIDLEAGAGFLVREIRAADNNDVEVVALAPGTSEVGTVKQPTLTTAFECVLEPASQPILLAHVLDGRPVVPLALTMEWLAHGALHQNPGLVFHGCDNLRVLHGIILEGGAPMPIRVAAGRAVKDGSFFRAPVELSSPRSGGRELAYARAEIILATELPTAGTADPGPSLPPYGRSLEEVYGQLLFHGPDLHAIERIEGCDAWNFVARLRCAPPPASWIERPLRHKWLADPLVLDGAFQSVLLWGFERFGTFGLPCHVARYRQYRRSFPIEGVRAVVRITRATELHALANVDLLDGTGQLLARLEGCEFAFDPALQRAFRRNHLSGSVPAVMGRA
jgi:acyl transferase domain-containing protein